MQLRSSIRTLNAHEDILPKLYGLTHYTTLENEEILEAQFMNTPGMRHTDIVPCKLCSVKICMNDLILNIWKSGGIYT
jgi:hypothetical protein